MKKVIVPVFLILVILIVSSGCAPGHERWNEDQPAGFITGLWHGFIVIITFIISLFIRNIGIYEVHNTGWPYNLGFLIGLNFAIIAPWKWGTSKKKC